MKKALFILSVIIFARSLCFGQENVSNNIKLYNSSRYLYIVYLTNGKMLMSENFILSSKTSDVTAMLSKVETICRYGIITKAGSIILKMKLNEKFISTNQIFDLFHIDNQYRNLSVYIDDGYVERPETILTEKEEIANVKIMTSPYDGKGLVINVITKAYDISKKIKEVPPRPYSTYYLQNSEIKAIDTLLYSKKR